MSGTMELFAIVANLLTTIGVMCLLHLDTTPARWEKWIFVGGVLIIQLPLNLRLLKNWNATMERAASYEESFL